MVIKNWQNQQNSFIFHMTPIAYEEKHCKIAQYCVYVLLSYFVFREKLREGRTKLLGSGATVHCTVLHCSQSHPREVPRWKIFMEHELRFGLDLGRLVLLKKQTFGLIMSNF